jgi:hypothetical protein
MCSQCMERAKHYCTNSLLPNTIRPTYLPEWIYKNESQICNSGTKSLCGTVSVNLHALPPTAAGTAELISNFTDKQFPNIQFMRNSSQI